MVMDVELLAAAKADLERLRRISERYLLNTHLNAYSTEDRREVKSLQANLKVYADNLRQAKRPP